MDKLLNTEKPKTEGIEEQFSKDTQTVAEQTALFVKTMQPSSLIRNKKAAMKEIVKNSAEILGSVNFYRLVSCATEQIDNLPDYLNKKMTRLFSALHSLNCPIVYGIEAHGGRTSLVLGVYGDSDKTEAVKSVTQGLLDGIELADYTPDFTKQKRGETQAGFISGIPTVKLQKDKQTFEWSSLMKSMNGHNYIALCMMRPVSSQVTAKRYGDVLQIRDACFAVSKRTLSDQQGITDSSGKTSGSTITESHSESKSVSTSGGMAFIISINGSESKSISESKSFSESISQSVSRAISQSKGVSHDVQNGFALEIMAYADKAIERLRSGNSSGMWETVITYSAETKQEADLIRACITGEFAKPNPDILPFASCSFSLDEEESALIPVPVPKCFISANESSNICTALTSEELSTICSVPTDAVPDFEMKRGKVYPLVSDGKGDVEIGCVAEGTRSIKHMRFALSRKDLAKHTFVCGITGSGKTTTVKRILREAYTPFLVIESAKKEYRNIKLNDNQRINVYTPGKPELNCPCFNPFYIQCGVSPQMHIDFLKDLFNASFSFYGPMPYILEKCLHNIYTKKGWNLTLGIHPRLVKRNAPADLFEADHLQAQYEKEAHRYLFPTMQDLKDEIKRYIEEEMQYEGEVAGNIKTAILARLENLCSGAKGYMFNTSAFLDMDNLMNRNAVFELEGLADDSDKAFFVGLMIILITEYRQVKKEIQSVTNPLEHLLVIEEAHRLLKNVDTQRSIEEMGNPQGKAVEHFTNIIAEMRSYGEGVIVAEQIPSKLAPDVIKNSSNKIIQRLVAADDQRLVANTIGISESEALYIGSLTTGKALCHKEGMSLPINVSIDPVEEKVVFDSALYQQDVAERLSDINYNLLRECTAGSMDEIVLKILNSVLLQEFEYVKDNVYIFRKFTAKVMTVQKTELIACDNKDELDARLLTNGIMKFLNNGVYSVNYLVPDSLLVSLREFLTAPDKDSLEQLRNELKKLYRENTDSRCVCIISNLILRQMNSHTDFVAEAKSYFLIPDEKSITEILLALKERIKL